MSDKMVTLEILGEKKQYQKGTSFLSIAQEYQGLYPDDIVLVVYNHRLREIGRAHV